MTENAATLQLEGDKELMNLFEQLPGRVTKKVLRKAMNLAANPPLKAARAKVSRVSGLLKKSIKKKVKLNVGKGIAIALIGADRQVQATREVKINNAVGRVLRLRKNKLYRPSRVLHLVEKGHKGPRPAPPHPFIEPAFEETKAQSAEIASSELKNGVETEAAKLGKL